MFKNKEINKQNSYVERKEGNNQKETFYIFSIYTRIDCIFFNPIEFPTERVYPTLNINFRFKDTLFCYGKRSSWLSTCVDRLISRSNKCTHSGDSGCGLYD